MPKEKVEGYKLTPETVGFSKDYKKQLAGFKFLQKHVMVKTMELQKLSQAMNQEKGVLMQMLEQAPKDMTNDLAHQPRDGER